MARFTTARGFDRLVNFSDATVAIALTLLVLPLADLATQAARIGAGAVITQHFDAVFAFILSFVVIAVIWTEHHGLFESLVDYSPWLMRSNFVWLLAVVALPFSTEVNQQAPAADRIASALYIGNLLLAFLAIAAMRIIALRDPDLIDPERREGFHLATSIALVGLCALALVLAVTVPGVGMWALLLLVLAGPASRLLRLRRPRANR